MVRQNLFKKFYVFQILLLSLTCHIAQAATTWETLGNHLEYSQLMLTSGGPWAGKIHAYRFSLNDYYLRIGLAGALHQQTTTVKRIAQHFNALIAVNGGFFTPEPQPIGLRVDNGSIVSPLKRTSWWGVFYSKNNQAFITSPKAFIYTDNINFAVQGGPRLIVNNHIPSLKPGESARTALGITRQGQVIILATQNIALSTRELAEVMQRSEKDNGLNCTEALNLDGGYSSQLFARINSHVLDLPNFSSITDAVLVLPRDDGKKAV